MKITNMYLLFLLWEKVSGSISYECEYPNSKNVKLPLLILDSDFNDQKVKKFHIRQGKVIVLLCRFCSAWNFL